MCAACTMYVQYMPSRACCTHVGSTHLSNIGAVHNQATCMRHTYHSYNSRTCPAPSHAYVQNTPCSTLAAHVLNKCQICMCTRAADMCYMCAAKNVSCHLHVRLVLSCCTYITRIEHACYSYPTYMQHMCHLNAW